MYQPYPNNNYYGNNGYGNNNNMPKDTIVMKQNVFDLGMRVYLMNRSSGFRPFLGGGGAYSRSFINYDRRIIDSMRQSGMGSLTYDYTVSQYLGYLGGGMDIRLSKSVSLGALFKYYNVLSSTENQKLNNGAIYGHYYGAPSYYSADADKQQAGGSLSRSNFYSVMAGATFNF